MVINTNVNAQQTTHYLNMSSAGLAKSLSRLSSGQKIITPSDDAAGLAVSSRLDSQLGRIDATMSNLTNAVSFTQTQDGFMKTLDKAFRRMSELTIFAQDETKSPEDLALYNEEFRQLKEYIKQTIAQDYNSVSLFGSNSKDVTISAAGATFSIPGIDMAHVSYADAYSASCNILTATFAQQALGFLKTAVSRLAQDRASLGAVQSRLNFTTEQLMVTKENLSAAISRIADVDVADEATAYARFQILVQSGTSMLAQANQMPLSALTLLKG